MVLRFVLVSLVASLGIELPETADLSRWMGEGRAWLSAQGELGKIVGEDVIEVVEDGDEAAAPVGEVELAESVRRAGDSESIEVVDVDEEVVGGIIEVVETDEVVVEDVVFVSVVGEMAAAFSADALDGFVPEAVELSQGEVPEIAAEAVEAVAGEGVGRDEAVEAVEIAAGPSRTERLGVAVQLTGQAFHAWMGVFRQATPLVMAR